MRSSLSCESLRSYIPAVKITGSLSPPETPSIDSMMLPVSMCPDPCLSLNINSNSTESDKSEGGKEQMAGDCTKMFDKEQVIPSLLKDEVTEFDSFLLDAVQWL
mmetsp:Transcript_43109/g.48932  ORF Transcript_43109/g.48932 Transcript_43109/m.48932 type:complete len:104 (+) Transcript_43109:995-1306(+)